MSKKLIAVAAAAALALTGLVAPANAAFATLDVSVATPDAGGGPSTTVVGSGLTSTAAWEVAVPSQDVIRNTATASRSALALLVKTR
jgi:hypothetical protein